MLINATSLFRVNRGLDGLRFDGGRFFLFLHGWGAVGVLVGRSDGDGPPELGAAPDAKLEGRYRRRLRGWTGRATGYPYVGSKRRTARMDGLRIDHAL